MKFFSALLLMLFIVLATSCETKKETSDSTGFEYESAQSINIDTNTDTVSTYFHKRPDYILADIDGDTKQDSVIIMTDAVTKKEGLKIVLSSGRTDTLGMGKEVLGQGFNDISWAGIFEKAPKGEKHANNVDEDGNILAASQIPEEDWIILPNDGIYLHEEEACGGGVIYMENGEYKWIQED